MKHSCTLYIDSYHLSNFSESHLPSPEYHNYIIYVTEYYEILCQKLYLDHKELLFDIAYYLGCRKYFVKVDELLTQWNIWAWNHTDVHLIMKIE